MRIKMSGSYSIYNFDEAIDCIIQVLQHNGVDELRAVSIYFTPFSASCEIHFDDQVCGAPFQILRYMGSRHRTYKRISSRLVPESEFENSSARRVLYVQPGDEPSGRIDQFIGVLSDKVSRSKSGARSRGNRP